MKIYISYSHLDRMLAAQFHDHLTNNKFDVHWDQDLPMGGSLASLTDAMLDCDALLVIISKNSQNSDFVQSEMMQALGYSRVREKPRVLPYITHGTKIPFSLMSIQCFMGTEDVQSDLDKTVEILNMLKGTVIAESQESQERVENIHISLDSYIKDVFEKLEKNEKRNRCFSYCFYALSFIFLILSCIYALLKVSSIDINLTIPQSIQSGIANLLILTVIIALARLAFILGKSFMVESIRNGDRIHAISFGKFFIQAYGDKASRYEIREVFGEWNIDKGSSFYHQEVKDIDPNVLGAFEIIKSAIAKN